MTTPIKAQRRSLLTALALALAGCATSATAPPEATVLAGPDEEVQEIMPGLLEGYLPRDEQLDSVVFVLPAPTSDSSRQTLDTAWAQRMLELRGSVRWEQAIRDADLSFPTAAGAFSCALGIEISEAATPSLYMLLRRTLTDIGLSPYSAKNAYQRQRPFMVNGEPVCTPADEDALRNDGSYPSGHTAIGWGWALILTELSPAQAEDILVRGRSFGESRNVCNAHWYSDVVAGRLVAAGAVAKLHGNEQFLQAMAAAATDIAGAREAGLSPQTDCEAEAEALSASLL